jgi:alpha-beta hydrolase superfamily lysophospholipase
LPQPSSYQDSGEIIKLTTADGVKISAVHLPNPSATYTMLYSHGNAEDLGDSLPGLRELRDMGFAVFSYDYRGMAPVRELPLKAVFIGILMPPIII